MFQPPSAPNYHQSTLLVLVPRNFPGTFYYPPCKWELANQIWYYNPKTKEFYNHKAYTAMPPSKHLNDKSDRVRLVNLHDGAQYGTHNGVSALAREPEFDTVPAISANPLTGNHINPNRQAQALTPHGMPKLLNGNTTHSKRCINESNNII